MQTNASPEVQGGSAWSESSVCLKALRIPQRAESKCTVLVWRSGWLYKALQRSGHEGLLLRRQQDEGPWVLQDSVVPAHDDRQVRYVSFRLVNRHDSLRYTRKLQRGISAANRMVTALEALSRATGTAGAPREELHERAVGGELAALAQRFRALQWRNDHAAKFALLIRVLRETRNRLHCLPDPSLLGAARLILDAVAEFTSLTEEPWDPRSYYGEMQLPVLDCTAGLCEPQQSANS